nr:PREDICTED: uncharacterized protein LOC105671903 isoform X2 [Linepithema humile]
MNTKSAEAWLAWLYIGSMLLSVTSVVSLVTAWQHWAWTLDTCIGIDCGCILYGINTFNTFIGGDVKLCHFATYCLVPGIIIGLCLGGYHGYRCCVHKDLDSPKRMSRGRVYHDDSNLNNNGETVVVTVKRRAGFKQWIPIAFLTALICCLSLAHAVVITDGYYKTCNHYRRNLIQLLGSRASEIRVIHNRLPCGAIFDYMDYLQPDTNNWRRASEINTGFALQLAICASWFTFFAWFLACLINFSMARRRLHSIGEKFCYCC